MKIAPPMPRASRHAGPSQRARPSHPLPRSPARDGGRKRNSRWQATRASRAVKRRFCRKGKLAPALVPGGGPMAIAGQRASGKGHPMTSLHC
jgi:hypothetical protein